MVPDAELAGRIVSLVFGMLLVYISFLFARRLFRDNGKALLVAFLAAIQPYLVRYSGQVLSESLAAFLFAATVFTFYVGWQERKTFLLSASGLCLVLTYLTRPEYLVFYAPFAGVLLAGRRFRDAFAFLLPFLCLGAVYMGLLRLQTGMWLVCNKATLSPFVPFTAFFANVPVVAYEWCVALFPPFLFFAIFGFRDVARPYGNLALLLLVFHILSLAFICHATRRYSVEFAPLSLVFAAEGIYAFSAFLARLPRGKVIGYVLAALVVASAVAQSFTPSRPDRRLQKEAGLFLLRHDAGSVVAARLPLVAFYEKGVSVDLQNEMAGKETRERFELVVREKRVKYLVIDEKTAREMPFLEDYAAGRPVVAEFRGKGCFLRLYRLTEAQ